MKYFNAPLLSATIIFLCLYSFAQTKHVHHIVYAGHDKISITCNDLTFGSVLEIIGGKCQQFHDAYLLYSPCAEMEYPSHITLSLQNVSIFTALEAALKQEKTKVFVLWEGV